MPMFGGDGASSAAAAAAAAPPVAGGGTRKRKGGEEHHKENHHKLLEAVAALTLIHESERRSAARDQNVVFQMAKDSGVAVLMAKGSDEYARDGKVARENAESQGTSFEGNPNGKKPDALLRLLLWRVAEAITDDVVTKAQTAVQQDPAQEAAAKRALEVLQRVRQMGLVQKDNKALRATRCFTVASQDKGVVKWIWSAQAVPELVAMGRELHETKALRLVGIEVMEDEAPQARAAKDVRGMLDSLASGSRGKGKGSGKQKR